MDLFLARAVALGGLADFHAQGVAPGQLQDLWADQAIVEQHIGLAQRTQGMPGEQAGVAGAGTDQGHAAGESWPTLVRGAGDRAGWASKRRVRRRG